jgi:hypothetical protein
MTLTRYGGLEEEQAVRDAYVSLHESCDGISEFTGVDRVSFDCMPPRRLALSTAAVAVRIFVTTIKTLTEEEWIHCGRCD